MTKEKLMTISDYLWKIMLPVFLAVVSFLLQSAASELRDLKHEISGLRKELQALSIDVVALKTRMNFYEKMVQ